MTLLRTLTSVALAFALASCGATGPKPTSAVRKSPCRPSVLRAAP